MKDGIHLGSAEQCNKVKINRQEAEREAQTAKPDPTPNAFTNRTNNKEVLAGLDRTDASKSLMARIC